MRTRPMNSTVADWTEDHVRRLFWRAGFGATPGEAADFAARGREATLAFVLDGPGTGAPMGDLVGTVPTVKGQPLDPINEWGHDALWWLDRMVRTTRPLVEKMTLFWHDHFATASQDTPLMIRQNWLLRSRGLGDFHHLLDGVTRDPAMQLFLSLADSTKDAPNENYARELMELFTLGGGYTETDVREVSRALTGWRTKRSRGGLPSIHWQAGLHDIGSKRIFGRTGRFGTQDVMRLVTQHPRHAPFLVQQLWDFFVTEPLDPATRAALVRTYRGSGLQLKPVVAAILGHDALYARLDAPDQVKAPVVHVAGLLRTTGTPITIDSYTWLLNQMGQMPFAPPSVAGWDWGPSWLSTNAMRARVTLANTLLAWGSAPLKPPAGAGNPAWSAEQHLDAALAAMGRPWLSGGSRAALLGLAAGFYDGAKPRQDRADMLQRLLRHLLISGPDAQLC
jgi:uncharacterized protein (DUF1800 family)